MKISIAMCLASALVMLPINAGSEPANGKGDTSGHSSHHGTAPVEGGHQPKSSAGPVGLPAHSAAASQTVKVSLTDEMKITFDQDLKAIRSGSIVTFMVTNTGKIRHEFSIGNQEEQQAHAAMMRQMPGMTHSDGNTLTVEPGTTMELTWNFKGDEVVVFACNIPGHYEAGMFQKVQLSQ